MTHFCVFFDDFINWTVTVFYQSDLVNLDLDLISKTLIVREYLSDAEFGRCASGYSSSRPRC